MLKSLFNHLLDKMIYFVTVVTGNVRNGGTDANVFVEIEGSLGKTSPHRLNNGKKNMFERGAQDNFNVRKLTLRRWRSIMSIFLNFIVY